jgi:hypothetical protein
VSCVNNGTDSLSEDSSLPSAHITRYLCSHAIHLHSMALSVWFLFSEWIDFCPLFNPRRLDENNSPARKLHCLFKDCLTVRSFLHKRLPCHFLLPPTARQSSEMISSWLQVPVW